MRQLAALVREGIVTGLMFVGIGITGSMLPLPLIRPVLALRSLLPV